jgi:hypothetical protein
MCNQKRGTLCISTRWSSPWCGPKRSWSTHSDPDLLYQDDLQTEIADPFNYIRKVSSSSQHTTAETRIHATKTHRAHLRSVSCFKLQNMYIPRAQALSETFPQNPQIPLISFAFYSFLKKMSSAAKQLTPNTRSSGKTTLVTGRTLSTTAQTHSRFSSSFNQLYSKQ